MFETISLGSLAESLKLDQEGERHLISLVGGGGKTTLLHALGNQLLGRTVLTTTTKMGHLAGVVQPKSIALHGVTPPEHRHMSRMRLPRASPGETNVEIRLSVARTPRAYPSFPLHHAV